MIANYHTHTERCQHALGEDREFIESAINGGMKILGFSDHCPWVFPNGYISGTRMLPNQLDEYFTTMDTLKKEYQKDIKIYVGFEAEYIPELMEEQNKLLKGYPIDYMILGQHFNSPEYNSMYTGCPNDDSQELKKYVDLIIEALNTGKYSYVAHPDLFYFVGNPDLYDFHYGRLCKYLKEKNIPVEINLLGLFEGRHYPCDRFFKLAMKYQNSAIIGCDAHTPNRLENIQAQKQCVDFANKYNLKIMDTLPNLD